MRSGPFEYFVILGTMRTGSNLLQDLLDQVSGIACYGELFNPNFVDSHNRHSAFGISQTDRDRDPIAMILAMRNAASDELPGFRLFDGHDRRVLTHVLDDPACAKVILTRDLLESFVSLQIAKETGQWILRGSGRRKSARVSIQPQAFRDYQNRIGAYYRDIDRRLAESGQAAFRIGYDDIRSRKSFEGLVRYLGRAAPTDQPKPRLRRQNPEPLSEKVVNLSELSDAALSPRMAKSPTPNIQRLYLCRHRSLVFFDMPGTRSEAIRHWLEEQSGETVEPAQNRKAFDTWRRANQIEASFTLVEHPLRRAHDTFCQKVLTTGSSSFLVVRRHIAKAYSIDLPPEVSPDDVTAEALAAHGYRLGAHRVAFHGFLKFIASNLAGKNGLRRDPRWITQSELLAQMSTVQPITHVLKSPEMDAFFQKFGKKGQHTTQSEGQPFALSDVANSQTFRLCRRAFVADYEAFGFSDEEIA